MSRILVLFYSTYGHCFRMAQEAMKGVTDAGSHAVLQRIPETLPMEVLTKMGAVEAQKKFEHVPAIDRNQLKDYDGFIFICPTRFGNIPSQVAAFLDSTGQLWMEGSLVGKVGSAMCTTATQHGGQERTLQCFHNFFLHQGMIIVGLPFSKEMPGAEEVKGGTPYGATSIAGPSGERFPSAIELAMVHNQAQQVAQIAAKLAK